MLRVRRPMSRGIAGCASFTSSRDHTMLDRMGWPEEVCIILGFLFGYPSFPCMFAAARIGDNVGVPGTSGNGKDRGRRQKRCCGIH